MAPGRPPHGTSDPQGLLPDRALHVVADRFGLLSSPSRLRILNALMDGPLGMGPLALRSGLEQSNLSRHVSALERGGCVRRRREGQQVIVEVADPTLKPLCDLVCGALQERVDRQQRLFG